jgi:hypothetical protein
MISSTNTKRRYLAKISPLQARRFLEELANVGDTELAENRFNNQYADFFPDAGYLSEITVVDPGLSQGSGFVVSGSMRPLLGLRDRLRQVWSEPDPGAKEWMTFLLRLEPSMSVDMMAVPPAPNGFQQSVIYLLKNGNRARRCENLTCTSPYFWAARKSQKFCNDGCALPAKQAAKRKWWTQNGSDWRTSKKKHKKRQKRKPS